MTCRVITSAAASLGRLLATVLFLSAACQPAFAGCLNGVNLAGAEFGNGKGVYGKDYTYPSETTIRYFAAKGFNTVRLPFRWERLQPRLKGKLDPDELQRIRQSVAQIRAQGLTVILDPHNFGRYTEKVIGDRDVTDADFADLWSRLAKVFANQPGILFGLMNEPFDMPPAQWLTAANAAIAGLRQTGAKNLVLVPGVAWTGAHSWQSDIGGASNAGTMIGIRDPADNYVFEVHQYLDSDFSGSHPQCSRAADAVAALDRMTDWFRANGKRGFLGEFGGAANADCMTGLATMTAALAKASDVWIGWTYWAAGDWWSPDEPMNIQPTADGDRLQLKALTARKLAGAADACPALDASTQR